MSTNYTGLHEVGRRTIIVILAFIVLMLGTVLSIVNYANALDYPKLPNRSLHVADVTPGATTTYTISWRYPSNTTIGSIRLLLCADPIIEDPCVSPGGDMSAASLTSQTGITGFSIDSQTGDEILLTRAPGAASTVQSTYVFDNMTNPGGLQRKFFIRIQTFASGDGSGSFNHASSVANATTEPIVINSEVPQILYFCTGITIDEWCTNINGDFIDYGDLSSDTGHFATSQFGAATNALGGYAVTINGKTMTAGNKSIEALDTAAAFTTGVPQFGLNLRANTSPAIGQDAFGAGIGVVSTNYDTPDLFKFTDGDVIATAVTGTLFNTYTVTYIVNVPPDQPAGIYNTTVAYICTAAF